jgi:putative lipoic acid-binding regulatory protein
MEQLPSLASLEAGHSFPCNYLFKVIGKTDDGFVARAVAAARDQIDMEADPPFRTKETPGGRHVSVTLELPVQTAEQVLEIYRRLLKLTGLVVLW